MVRAGTDLRIKMCAEQKQRDMRRISIVLESKKVHYNKLYTPTHTRKIIEALLASFDAQRSLLCNVWVSTAQKHQPLTCQFLSSRTAHTHSWDTCVFWSKMCTDAKPRRTQPHQAYITIFWKCNNVRSVTKQTGATAEEGFIYLIPAASTHSHALFHV
jgi:hypothetical protein